MFRMLSTLPFLFLAILIAGCDIKLGGNYKVQQGVVADTEVSGTMNDGFTNGANDTLAWVGNDSTVTRPETIQVTDTTDPPGETQDGENTIPACTTDNDCPGDGRYYTDDLCENGTCVYPPWSCDRSSDCDDRNACNGQERCALNGFCVGGEQLDCNLPSSSEDTNCHPATGCYVFGDHSPECIQDEDCAPSEYCDTGTHFCVEADATCIANENCDDWNGCTADRCLGGTCDNGYIGCQSDDPSTKASCNPDGHAGCEWSPYIFLQALLEYPHNRDEVWVYFSLQGPWHGFAPYLMHVPVEDACEDGIWVDFKDPETGQWYSQISNPPAEQVEYLAVDTVVVNPPFNINGNGGRGIYINKTKLGCPLVP